MEYLNITIYAYDGYRNSIQELRDVDVEIQGDRAFVTNIKLDDHNGGDKIVSKEFRVQDCYLNYNEALARRRQRIQAEIERHLSTLRVLKKELEDTLN